MWHLVGKVSWGGSRDCLAWWFWFGGVVGWCSSWCSATATGEPLDGSSNRLHGAEQKVSFKGEAVGGTVDFFLCKRGGEAGKEGFSANEKKAWRKIWCGFFFQCGCNGHGAQRTYHYPCRKYQYLEEPKQRLQARPDPPGTIDPAYGQTT